MIHRFLSLLSVLVLCLGLNSNLNAQDDQEFCYFSMMLDDSKPFPTDFRNSPAALLVSVIDYTNIYVPVDWEKPLAQNFVRATQKMGIDFKVAASGIVLNKKGGDPELAKKLRAEGVKYVVLYTLVYQRTPQKIKTGHTVTVVPFTGDARIVDMGGTGHWYIGSTMRMALDYFQKEYQHAGTSSQPEFIGLSEKSRVTKVVDGLPDLSKADLFMHGYFDACIPTHTPLNTKWASHYDGLPENNKKMAESRQQLDDLVGKYRLTLNTLYLVEDLNKATDANDYVIVPLDDKAEVIRNTFVPIKDKGFMNNVPHDLENPYYLFALFHPSSGTLHVPKVDSRGYGTYFDSLEDLLREIKKVR